MILSLDFISVDLDMSRFVVFSCFRRLELGMFAVGFRRSPSRPSRLIIYTLRGFWISGEKTFLSWGSSYQEQPAEFLELMHYVDPHPVIAVQ